MIKIGERYKFIKYPYSDYPNGHIAICTNIEEVAHMHIGETHYCYTLKFDKDVYPPDSFDDTVPLDICYLYSYNNIEEFIEPVPKTVFEKTIIEKYNV